MASLNNYKARNSLQKDSFFAATAAEFELPPQDSTVVEPRVRPSTDSLDILANNTALYCFLAEARDIRSFLQRAHNLLHRIGITDFAHILLQSEKDVKKIWIYPKKEHAELQLYPHDMMVQHALMSDKPLFQHEIKDFIDRAPFENEIFALNRNIHRMVEHFKIYDYYHIAFNSACGQGRALFACGAKHASPEQFAEQVAKNSDAIERLARAIDSVGGDRFDMHYGAPPRSSVVIHDKPLQLLNVLANKNISLNDAARELHISISTANQHIAAAKKALGANTTAAAIITAVKLGLITIER